MSALEPEDEARAALYGVIAQLFYAAPSREVLAGIVNANSFGQAETGLALRWRELAQRCNAASAAALENEHTELFIGTGRAEVTPYLTHYMADRSTDNPLVQLRRQHIDWGIGRSAHASEPEDHIASVCETMRFAIAVQHRQVEEQRIFFNRFLYPAGVAFCSAVVASQKADFYRAVAAFAAEFFELEHNAFEIS